MSKLTLNYISCCSRQPRPDEERRQRPERQQRVQRQRRGLRRRQDRQDAVAHRQVEGQARGHAQAGAEDREGRQQTGEGRTRRQENRLPGQERGDLESRSFSRSLHRLRPEGHRFETRQRPTFDAAASFERLTKKTELLQENR